MAVCSFLSHESIYDADIEDRLQAAADQVVNENESVEFLLNNKGRIFYDCLLAALRAKARRPQAVTITITYHGYRTTDGEDTILSQIADKILTFNPEIKQNNSNDLFQTEMWQWIIHQSTHLITCLYDKLCEPENQVLDYAKARDESGALTIINIASPETEQVIVDSIQLLSNQEQTVLHNVIEGNTLKEAGKMLGIRLGQTRQILEHGCRKIKRQLYQRCLRIQDAEQEKRRRICGIFAMGNATYESLVQFDKIIQFLSSLYQVKHFYVEHTLAHSCYMFPLMHLSSISQPIHVTVVTSEELLAQMDCDPDTVVQAFCPPFSAVSCVNSAGSGHNTGFGEIIADIMEHSDFCICNLSAAPNPENIEKYNRLADGQVLFDIGKIE